MKLAMACLAAAFYVTANSTIIRAHPQSVEATEDAAKADHQAAEKQANTAAVEGAKAETKTKTAQAGVEATERKMETDYMFAKEKCDPLFGKANSACIAEAKTQYQH